MNSGQDLAAAAMARAVPPSKAKPARSWRRSSVILAFFQGDEIRMTRRFTDFKPGDAISPNDVLLLSKTQSALDQGLTTKTSEASSPPVLFDKSAEIEWSPVWSLRDKRFRYLPTILFHFFFRGAGEFPRGFQRLRSRQHSRGSHGPGFP